MRATQKVSRLEMPPRRRASVVEADSDYSGSDYDAEDMMDGDAAGEGAAEGAGTKEPGDPSSTAKPLVVIKKGKKFKCPECTETFARVYELRRHQTVHRDERSFVCETCGAAFARKDALIRHVRSAQGNCERRASGGGRGRKPRREKLPSPPATASESPPPAPIEQPTLPPIQSIQNPFSVDIAEIPTGPIADLRPRSASFSSPTLPSPVLDPNVLFSPSFAATSIGTTAFQSNSSSDSVFHTVSGQYHVPLEPVATGTIPLPSMPISAASMTDVGLSVPMTVAPIIPPIPAQSFPFATVPPAVAKTAKPAQKPRSKRPMYGPFALVPLPKNMAPLFELYSQHGWIHHPIIHLPTLFHRLHLLSATPQSAADYAELELCPVTVQAVLWTTFRLAEHDEAVERWGAACWSNITMWAASLGIGPGSQPSDATPEEFVAFVQAGVIAGNVCLALGKYSDATWLRESSIRAHRAAKFGSSPKDSCIPDGSGGWTTRRDSRDLSAWIAAEERARAGSWLILWDSTASDVQGTRGTMVGGGYVLRDGEIRCVERSGYTGEEHLEPGHYHNVPLPCPDFLFEQLPPAPTNAKERDEWLRRDAASGGIIKWITIPYGEAINWVDLPYGSARRKKMLGVLIGGFLRSGYVRNCITNSGLQIRLVQYREYCRSRGFKLNDLPMGWAKDETRAREMRDSLVLQLRDIWENLPPEVREADEEGNGEKLKELATRWWGSKYDASMFVFLAPNGRDASIDFANHRLQLHDLSYFPRSRLDGTFPP